MLQNVSDHEMISQWGKYSWGVSIYVKIALLLCTPLDKLYFFICLLICYLLIVTLIGLFFFLGIDFKVKTISCDNTTMKLQIW